MYLNEEEDEKSPDPFTYDIKVYESMKRLFEQKVEDLKSAFNLDFIAHFLSS